MNSIRHNLRSFAFGIVTFASTGTVCLAAGSINETQLLKLANKRFTNVISAIEAALFRAAANGEELSRTNQSVNADRLAWLCADPYASALVNHRGIRISD